MLRKLVPFLSVFLLAGPVFAADAPSFAHNSYASSAKASDTGRHRHHRHPHHRRRHPH
jgi:hypothetical protein